MKEKGIIAAFIRRKHIDFSSIDQTKLNRCLTTFDLTALGVGSTLGLGVYVLAGDVASRDAGPAVCLSFLIAAIASVFAGLCYAEFGARVPKAGSAYIYSYVTVGELMALVIGWNLVLEYIIGTASVARGYSGYVDALFNGSIQTNLEKLMPIHISGLSSYPDFVSFGLTILLTIMLAIGVKESSKFNSLFTVLNLAVVLFVVIVGSIKIDFHNWALTESEVNGNATHTNNGSGGFFPFGYSGMMKGAATCFYAFVGFDAIATTGEEAKNPKRSIPISIIISLTLIFLAYFSVSSVQTLMLPYYLQSDEQTKGAPLPYIFEQIGWHWAKWIVSIGALTGLSTSLLGVMFPLPRILYAMANDGIIFRFLATVNKRFQTPLIATVISGVFAACMACLFNITELVDMSSIGTLLAYTLVSESILIIRFQYDGNDTSATNTWRTLNEWSVKNIVKQCFNTNRLSTPTRISSKIANCLIALISLLIVVFDLFLIIFENDLLELVPILCITFTLLFMIITFICLSLQPMSNNSVSFQVPFVPLVPLLSVFVNTYLMMKLSTATWIRFAVWMIVGFFIYGFYGIMNSNERQNVSPEIYCVNVPQANKNVVANEVLI